MAPSILPLSATEFARQRSMERQVFALLHRVHKPDALAANPLMAQLCRATATSSPLAALELVVKRALDEPQDALWRDAIFDADFNRLLTNNQLARQHGISRRHFQRRRSKAVAAIAQYARTVLAISSEPVERSQKPPVPRARHLAAWRFDRELKAYDAARDGGRVSEMRTIAANLCRLAQTASTHAVARQALAETHAHLGNVKEASELLDAVTASAPAVVRAQLSLLEMNGRAAVEHAQRGLRVAGNQDRYRLFVLISHGRLIEGAPWAPPSEAVALAASSPERIAMEAESARHLARQGHTREAEERAHSAHRRAERLGFQPIAARCAAALSATALARGSLASARWWRARATELLLRAQDRLLATGLFVSGECGASLGLDAHLIQTLYDRFCVIVPQMFGESGTGPAAVRDFLVAALECGIASKRRSPSLDRAVASVARSGSALSDYAQRCAPDIAESLALALTALANRPWHEAAETARELVEESARRLCPAVPRAIAIAVPRSNQSQLPRTEHLRIDERPGAGDGESVETLADIRLRFVPFRSGARPALSRNRGRTAARTPSAAASAADSR
jgi:hypothetical protein